MKKKILLTTFLSMLFVIAGCSSSPHDDPPPPVPEITFAPNAGSFEKNADSYQLILTSTSGEELFIKLYPTNNLSGKYLVNTSKSLGTILSVDKTNSEIGSWYKKQGANKIWLKTGILTIIISGTDFTTSSFQGEIKLSDDQIIKINVDNITLEDKTEPEKPEPVIEFTPTTGSFKKEEGFYMFELADNSGDKVSLTLYPTPTLVGDYLINSSKAVGTILSTNKTEGEEASWYQEKNAVKLWFNSGNLTISINGDDFTNSSFQGEIKLDNEQILQIKADNILLEDKSDPVEPEPTMFNTATATYNLQTSLMNLTLISEEGDEIYLNINLMGGLSGKYPINTTGDTGTIRGATESSSENASWYRMNDKQEKDYLISGTIDLEIVSDEGSEYLIATTSGIATSLSGILLSINTNRVNLSQFIDYKLIDGELMYYGQTEGQNTAIMCLYLKDGKAGSMTFNTLMYMNIEIQTDKSNLHLPSGTYTAAPGTWAVFTFNDKNSVKYPSHWYTIGKEGGLEGHNPIKGTVEVSKTAEIYTINAKLFETEYSGVTFTWVGKLPMEDYSY